MEYKPLDLNKKSLFSQLHGLIWLLIFIKTYLCSIAGHVSTFSGQFKSNINTVYTSAKVSLFWSFDWLFSVSSLQVLA